MYRPSLLASKGLFRLHEDLRGQCGLQAGIRTPHSAFRTPHSGCGLRPRWVLCGNYISSKPRAKEKDVAYYCRKILPHNAFRQYLSQNRPKQHCHFAMVGSHKLTRPVKLTAELPGLRHPLDR